MGFRFAPAAHSTLHASPCLARDPRPASSTWVFPRFGCNRASFAASGILSSYRRSQGMSEEPNRDADAATSDSAVAAASDGWDVQCVDCGCVLEIPQETTPEEV